MIASSNSIGAAVARMVSCIIIKSLLLLLMMMIILFSMSDDGYYDQVYDCRVIAAVADDNAGVVLHTICSCCGG